MITLCVLKMRTCAENRLVIHNASEVDELKLLSSLNTLGYIEFDVPCNLSSLAEKLYAYAVLPWFSRHIYHVFGKYNNKGQYMMERVYICTNPNSPFVVQSNDQLEDSKINTIVKPYSSSFAFRTQVEFKEREHMFLVSTNLLQDSIGKDRVYFNRADYMSVGQDMLQTCTYGHILSHNIVHSHYFRNLVCPHVVQDRLQAKSTSRMTFHQEREDDKDMSSTHTTIHGALSTSGRLNFSLDIEILVLFSRPHWST